MLREKLIDKKVGQGKFRWRSHEVSRIEGLSDAVFGFAITLLVVSLEVPKTFTELSEMMNGFGAFAISFLLLFLVWFNQHKFFRRYGLQDAPTVWLNAALLFVVLFYVYPLKFLFTFLVNRFTGGHGEIRLPNGNVEEMIQNDGQMGTLMLIFGAGYFAVFAVFVLLHLHAYRKRELLELTKVERFDTLSSVQESALNCGIALLSICMVLIGGARYAGYAGMIYMATGIVMGIHGYVMGSRRQKLVKQQESDPASAAALKPELANE
jgi:uncharacterized membrane protein